MILIPFCGTPVKLITVPADSTELEPLGLETDWRCLPLVEAIASRAVLVIISGSDGRAGGNAFGAAK